jgi:hypothetical protein
LWIYTIFIGKIAIGFFSALETPIIYYCKRLRKYPKLIKTHKNTTKNSRIY